MTTDDKYNHFEIGYKGPCHGFCIFAANLKEALKPVRMTTAGMDKPQYHDVLSFGDRFILPASHMKRLLATCQHDTVLTFCFADDMKSVSIEIDEGSRPTVITFRNQIVERNAVYKNYFIWDIDPILFPPSEPAKIAPEPTPQPTEQPETAVSLPATPKPRKRRQTAKKPAPQPVMPVWVERLVSFLYRLADRLDPAV